MFTRLSNLSLPRRLSNLSLPRGSSVSRKITFPTPKTFQVPDSHVALQHLEPSTSVPSDVDPFSGTNVPATLRFARGSNPSPTGAVRRGCNSSKSDGPVVTHSVFVKCQPILRAIIKEFMPPQVENFGSIVMNLLSWVAQQVSKSEVERTETEPKSDELSTSTFLDYMNSLDDYEKKVAASVILFEFVLHPIHIRLSQFKDSSSSSTTSSNPTHRENMVKIIQFCKEQLPEKELEASSAKLISLYLISYFSQSSTEDIVTIHDEKKKNLVNSLFSDIKNSFFPLRVTSKGLQESHKDEHRKGLDFIKRMNQVPRLHSEQKNALKEEIKDTLLEFAEKQLNDAVANEPEDLKERLRDHVADTLRALGDKLDKELLSDQPGVSPFYTSKDIDFSDSHQAQNDITIQQLDEIEKLNEIEKMRLKSSGSHGWWFYLGMG